VSIVVKMTLGKSPLTAQYEKKWLSALYFYLWVDLARFQDLITELQWLVPGVVSTVLLSFFLLGSKQIGYVYSIFPQIKRIVFIIALLFVFVPFADGERAALQAATGMLQYLPFILSVVILVNSKARLVQLCKAFGLIIVYICAFSLFHDGRGPGGCIIDENDLCLFIVCTMPLLFFSYQQERKKIIQLFWVAAVLLSLATIVGTFSRGGFVGLLAMGFGYFICSRRKIIIALCAICLFTAIFFFSGDKYKEEMATISDTGEATASERLLTWQAATKMFLDKPLGVGGNNFGRHFPDYQSAELGRNMWGRVAHSLWFTLISETGVVGIALYFSIIFFNLKDLLNIRKYKWPSQNDDDCFFNAISVALLASLLGFFAAGSFISVLYYPIFWYLTALVVCTRKIHSSLISVP